MSPELQNSETVEDLMPKHIKSDKRVAELLNDGWRFHSNYNPKEPGALEEVLSVSESFYYHPKRAREILIIDRAYDIMGKSTPYLKAVYMRVFKKSDITR